jgi:hypothetical protein
MLTQRIRALTTLSHPSVPVPPTYRPFKGEFQKPFSLFLILPLFLLQASYVRVNTAYHSCPYYVVPPLRSRATDLPTL